MRIFLVLIICIFLLQVAQANSFLKAQDDKLISLTISGNPDGTHYHTPLLMTITNTSTKTLNLDMDNGTLLQAEEEDYQNFVVTQDLIVQLKAKETKKLLIYAMCIESGDAAPGAEQNYRIGVLANSQVLEFSDFVEKNKLFEPNAQFVMWDLASGDYKDEQVDGFELDENGNIWILEDKDETVSRLNYVEEEIIEAPKAQLIVSGEFTMNLASVKNVHIAMFNVNNVLVKELYNNPKTPSGNTSLAYSFNSLEYEEDEYYIKLVVDGRVLSNRRVEMSY